MDRAKATEENAVESVACVGGGVLLFYERKMKMIEIDFWVIMDKSKKVIACGSPRNRELREINNLGKVRVMLYGTESKAKSAFTESGFYDFTKHMDETYGEGYKFEDVLIPVKARLLIDE